MAIGTSNDTNTVVSLFQTLITLNLNQKSTTVMIGLNRTSEWAQEALMESRVRNFQRQSDEKDKTSMPAITQ